MIDGDNRSGKILTGISHARWKGNLGLIGQRFSSGLLTEFKDADIGHRLTILRLINIIYTIGKNGFLTTLELEQDQKAIIALTST